MADIYDGVFRTILNDCRKLIIPVINEIFNESYTGEEEIRFFPNEHYMDQQDEADRERITDTNFTVYGNTPKKYHIECESSLPDGKIMIRLLEYDAQIALDEGEIMKETLVVTFPNTAVLYLRAYSLEDIFEKRLLLLIPFYIFSHEKSFSEYNSNGQKLEELKSEYQIILGRLDELEQQEFIGAFDKRTIIELSSDVIRELAQKYENVQKGLGDMMSGALIETSARRIKTTAEIEKQKRIANRMLQAGKLSVEEIAEYTELTVSEVEQLAECQTVWGRIKILH